LNILSKNIVDKFFYASIVLGAIGLFLQFNISSFLIILLIVSWILKDGLNKKKTYLKQSKKLPIVVSLFFLYVFGLLYSSDFKNGLTILERNLTLLILPIVFASCKPLELKKHYYILLSFAVFNILLGIFLIIIAFFNYFDTINNQVFYYDQLTAVINFHPIYLAMYSLFSLVIIVYGYQKKYFHINKILLVLIVSFFTLLLVLLSSKSMLGLLILFWIIFVIKQNRSKKFKASLLVASTILTIIVLFNFNTTKNRILEITNSKWDIIGKEHFEYNEPFTGSTLRIITWKLVTSHLFLDTTNPIIGTSPADAQGFIDDVYSKHGMDDAGYTGYNMHNQFFEMLVKFGLLGLGIYMFWIVVFFRRAFKVNKLYLLFLIIFFTVSITESVFEVHRGIVFFALFNSLFFFSERQIQD